MMGRSLKLLCIVSLTLNVFLLGAIAGGAYRWLAATHSAAATQPRSVRFAAEELSPERKKQFRLALRQARRDAAASIETARSGRLQIAGLLGAPQFDRAAVETALTNTREADMALRTRVEGAVVEFAATLTPDERVAMVDAMTRRGPLYVANPTAPASSPPASQSARTSAAAK
jgi:uncharacterized membrane protein